MTSDKNLSKRNSHYFAGIILWELRFIYDSGILLYLTESLFEFRFYRYHGSKTKNCHRMFSHKVQMELKCVNHSHKSKIIFYTFFIQKILFLFIFIFIFIYFIYLFIYSSSSQIFIHTHQRSSDCTTNFHKYEVRNYLFYFSF
jgi:hypothetical protein